MSKQIDFYILSTSESIPFTCRLLEKAFQQQHRIHVKTSDAATAKQLNETLWTFRDISFIPHRLEGDAGSPQAPITIGHDGSYSDDADILLLVDTTLPSHHERYARIIFVISNQEANKQQGRQSYQQLKEQGHSIQVHNV